MKILIHILLLYYSAYSFGQQINCKAFTQDKDYFLACRVYEKARKKTQGSKSSQKLLDRAIKKCPYFPHSYYVKAIPYLKRGMYIDWRKFIDQAVYYAPEEYLGYRGGCRFMFLKDYSGAIADINNLKEMVNFDIGYIYNGEYHLNIILALSYRELGNIEKSIEIIQDQLSEKGYFPGPYDYLHLGISEYLNKDYTNALKAFEQQKIIFEDIAEIYYYEALVQNAQGNKDSALKNLSIAKEFYLNGKCLPGRRSFIDYPDKIYLLQIERKIKEIK